MSYSYLWHTDRILYVFFLLLAVILSEFMRNTGEKIELQKKAHKRIRVRDIIMSFFVTFFV